MDITCQVVWREVSNYVDGEVSGELRAAIDLHASTCARCTSIIAGTKNIVALYGDERMFLMPREFSPALQRRLDAKIRPERGSAIPWILSLAGAGVVAAALLMFSLPRFAGSQMRAPMSEPAMQVPADMVAVTADGKAFHKPSCTYIHGPWKLISVEEAMREGYTPCIRCEQGLLHRAEDMQEREVHGAVDTDGD
jgi:anti-sigma factor RsiW